MSMFLLGDVPDLRFNRIYIPDPDSGYVVST